MSTSGHLEPADSLDMDFFQDFYCSLEAAPVRGTQE